MAKNLRVRGVLDASPHQAWGDLLAALFRSSTRGLSTNLLEESAVPEQLDLVRKKLCDQLCALLKPGCIKRKALEPLGLLIIWATSGSLEWLAPLYADRIPRRDACYQSKRGCFFCALNFKAVRLDG